MAKRPVTEPAEGPNVDVAIVGGGFVGRTAALALDGLGLSVAMIDRAPPEAGLDEAFDGRASAIALATHRVFRAVGAWDALADHAAPIRDIRVSEGGSRLHLHFDHRDLGDDPFGFQIENRHMRRSLYDAVRARPSIQWIAPATPTRLETNSGGGRIHLSDGRIVSARLIVGADGRGSWTRGQLGIPVTTWNYGQTAIVCAVRTERSHDFVAHEHFLPAGPFAILPLVGDPDDPGKRASIVWPEDPDLAKRIMALDDAAFADELRRRFGDFLGRVDVEPKRWAFPLSLQFARTQTGPRSVLVGDADHAMHPIAGQGLNMGLRDVAALYDVLAEAVRSGLDIGAADTLARYRRMRRFDNTRMLMATDGLTWLFSNRIRPLRFARDAGIAAVDRIKPLRRFFMKNAMGLVGEQPTLMKDTRAGA